MGWIGRVPWAQTYSVQGLLSIRVMFNCLYVVVVLITETGCRIYMEYSYGVEVVMPDLMRGPVMWRQQLYAQHHFSCYLPLPFSFLLLTFSRPISSFIIFIPEAFDLHIYFHRLHLQINKFALLHLWPVYNALINRGTGPYDF